MSDVFLKPDTNTTSVSFTNGAIWQGGTAPTSGDTAHLRDANLKFDLTLNHSGIKLGKLVIYDTFKGTFGGTGTNCIQISFDTGWFHVPAVRSINAVGSPLININHGTNAADITVYGSKQPPGTDTGLMPTRFLGSATSGTSLNVVSGSVAYGGNSVSETGTCQTLSATGNGAKVYVGSGITLSTVNVAAGEVDVNSAITTLNMTGGTLTTVGNWQMGTATLTGGRAIFNHRYSSGTEVSTLKLQGATLDLSQKADGFAATNTTIRTGTIQQFAYDQFTAGTLSLDFNGNRKFTATNAA